MLYIHLIKYIQDLYCESRFMWRSQIKKHQISDFIVIQKKLTLITLKNATANVLGNPRKISISSSTVHETALPKHLLMYG